MTNKEYIMNTIGGFGISETDADILLIKASLKGDDICDNAEAMKACDMAIYNRMSVVLKASTQNVTEGGYSLTWNMPALKAYYNSLCNELGVANVAFTKPTLKNRSNIW